MIESKIIVTLGPCQLYTLLSALCVWRWNLKIHVLILVFSRYRSSWLDESTLSCGRSVPLAFPVSKLWQVLLQEAGVDQTLTIRVRQSKTVSMYAVLQAVQPQVSSETPFPDAHQIGILHCTLVIFFYFSYWMIKVTCLILFEFSLTWVVVIYSFPWINF